MSPNAEGAVPAMRDDLFQRGRLRQTEGRLYTGIGIVVTIILALASVLIWTGVLGQMMTWGDWGFLTVPDLLGFLMVMSLLLSAGLIALLLTMRRAFRALENDLSVADRRVGATVLRLGEKMDQQIAGTRRLLSDEQKARAAQWNQEIEEATKEVRASGRNAAAIAIAQAEQQFLVRAKEERPVKDEVAALRERLEETRQTMATVAAQYAVLDELIGLHGRALAESQAHGENELRQALTAAQTGLVTRLDVRVEEEVRRQLRMRQERQPEAIPLRLLLAGLGAFVALLILASFAAADGWQALIPARTPCS